MKTRLWGVDHPGTFDAMNNLAAALLAQEKLEEAEDWYRQAYQGALNSPLAKEERRLIFRGNYANCLAKRGRFSEAEAHLLEVHGRMVEALGSEHPRTVKVAEFLVDLYQTWGKPQEAQGWSTQRSVTTPMEPGGPPPP
jgi:tetratricopeptide (TPR) repeat protein